MGVKFNGAVSPKIRNLQFSENSKNEFEFIETQKGEKESPKNLFIGDRNFSANGSEILANYTKNQIKKSNLKNHDRNEIGNIPNGHSKYEYNGARFDIFRHGDDYKSQFVCPRDFDRFDFFYNFFGIESFNPSWFNPHKDNQDEIVTPDIPDFDDNSDGIETINNDENAENVDLKINGEIDEYVIQGATGDCWLIAGIYSLSSNESGREIIKNSISTNSDGSAVVSFRGIGVSYTLSASEIMRHDTDNNENDSYSNGDNDMLVFELAVEKLWSDINKGRVTLDSNNEDITYTGEGNGIDDGGLPNQIIYYLTGIDSKESYHENLTDLNRDEVLSILNDAYSSSDNILSFGVYYGVHSANLIDGSSYELNLGDSGHALAITNMTADTVTFINPWDATVSYTMSWEEFANLGIGYIASADLSEAIEKDVADMTDSSSNSSKRNSYIDFEFDNFFPFDFNRDYSNFFNPFSDGFINPRYAHKA